MNIKLQGGELTVTNKDGKTQKTKFNLKLERLVLARGTEASSRQIELDKKRHLSLDTQARALIVSLDYSVTHLKDAERESWCCEMPEGGETIWESQGHRLLVWVRRASALLRTNPLTFSTKSVVSRLWLQQEPAKQAIDEAIGEEEEEAAREGLGPKSRAMQGGVRAEIDDDSLKELREELQASHGALEDKLKTPLEIYREESRQNNHNKEGGAGIEVVWDKDRWLQKWNNEDTVTYPCISPAEAAFRLFFSTASRNPKVTNEKTLLSRVKNLPMNDWSLTQQMISKTQLSIGSSWNQRKPIGIPAVMSICAEHEQSGASAAFYERSQEHKKNDDMLSSGHYVLSCLNDLELSLRQLRICKAVHKQFEEIREKSVISSEEMPLAQLRESVQKLSIIKNDPHEVVQAYDVGKGLQRMAPCGCCYVLFSYELADPGESYKKEFKDIKDRFRNTDSLSRCAESAMYNGCHQQTQRDGTDPSSSQTPILPKNR